MTEISVHDKATTSEESGSYILTRAHPGVEERTLRTPQNEIAVGTGAHKKGSRHFTSALTLMLSESLPPATSRGP